MRQIIHFIVQPPLRVTFHPTVHVGARQIQNSKFAELESIIRQLLSLKSVSFLIIFNQVVTYN